MFFFVVFFIVTWGACFFSRISFTKSIFYFKTGFGYGHPNGLHPFMLNPGWLDAAYMSYAFPEYFRQQPHNPQFAKGKYTHSSRTLCVIFYIFMLSNRFFGFVGQTEIEQYKRKKKNFEPNKWKQLKTKHFPRQNPQTNEPPISKLDNLYSIIYQAWKIHIFSVAHISTSIAFFLFEILFLHDTFTSGLFLCVK